MPLLKIQTNRQIEPDRARTIAAAASRKTAELLGKSERYVMVSLEHLPVMMFAGSEAPLAYLELKSIGLADEQTGPCARTLCEWVGQELDIPPDRIYIEFTDVARQRWGWNGRTFA